MLVLSLSLLTPSADLGTDVTTEGEMYISSADAGIHARRTTLEVFELCRVCGLGGSSLGVIE